MKKVIASVVAFAIMATSIGTSLVMTKTPMASAAKPIAAEDFQFKGDGNDVAMTATDTENGTLIKADNAHFVSRQVYQKPVSLGDFRMTLTGYTGDNLMLTFATDPEATIDKSNYNALSVHFTGNQMFTGHTNCEKSNLIGTGTDAANGENGDPKRTWWSPNTGYLEFSTEFAANGDLLIRLYDASTVDYQLWTHTISKAELEKLCIKDETTPIYLIFTAPFERTTYSFTVSDISGQITPEVEAKDFTPVGVPSCNISVTDTEGQGVALSASSAKNNSRMVYNYPVSLNDFSMTLENITRPAEGTKDFDLLLSTSPDSDPHTNGSHIAIHVANDVVQVHRTNEGNWPALGTNPATGEAAIWLTPGFTTLKIRTYFTLSGDLHILVSDGVKDAQTWVISKAELNSTEKPIGVKDKNTPARLIFAESLNNATFSFNITDIKGQTEEKIVYSKDFTSMGNKPSMTVQDAKDGGYLIVNEDPTIGGGNQDTCVKYNTPLKLDDKNNLHFRFTELNLPPHGLQIGLGGWAESTQNMFAILLTPGKAAVYKGCPAAVGDKGIIGEINFPAEQTSFDVTLQLNKDGSLDFNVNGSITTIPADKYAGSTLDGNEDALNVFIGMHGLGGTMSVKLNNIENLPPVAEGEGDASDANTAFGWRGQSSKATAKDTEDGVKLNFNNTTFVNQPMAYFDTIATKQAHKLDGLHLQIKDIQLDAESMKGLNVSFASSPYLIHDQCIIFLMNDYGAAVNVKPDPEFVDPDTEKPWAFEGSIAINQDLVDIFFVKEANGDFTVYATSNSTLRQTIPKEVIESCFGSADPSVYINISDKWYSQTGSNNSCVVTACENVENGFTSYYGEYLAGEEMRKRFITASYTGTFENIVINYLDNEGGMITTVRKMPLAGLTISGIDIDFNSMFRFGTSPGATTENGFTGQGPLIRLDENGDVYFTYTPGAGYESDMIGTFTDPNQTFTIQCVQKLDGGVNFFISGDKTGETFVKSASPEDITELYGSTENVMVYLGYSELGRSNNNDPKVTKIAKISNEEVEDVNIPVTKDDVSISISGDKATVTVDMAAGMGYSYQWFANFGKDANTGGEMIEGATSTTFTVPEGWDAGDYYIYCEVTSVSKLGTTTTVATDTVKYTVEGEPGGGDAPVTGVNEMGIIFVVALLGASAAVVVFRKKRSVK